MNKVYIINDIYKKCFPNFVQKKLYIVNNYTITENTATDPINSETTYEYLVYKEDNNDKMLIFLVKQLNIINRLINNEVNLQVCNFTFIAILIRSNDKSYDITNILKDNRHYYYIIGATFFDENFFKWIGLYHLKVNLEHPTVILMDNNINEIILTSSQYIKLNETNYTIMESNPI
jgi:hypothetical protein